MHRWLVNPAQFSGRRRDSLDRILPVGHRLRCGIGFALVRVNEVAVLGDSEEV